MQLCNAQPLFCVRLRTPYKKNLRTRSFIHFCVIGYTYVYEVAFSQHYTGSLNEYEYEYEYE